jgi:molybdopterin molybdotransferase
MSVGREDHIRAIIQRRGYLEIWPLAIKPGRPVGLGDIDDCPILALPGNPIAALVTFLAFGRTVVNVLSGAADEAAMSVSLPVARAISKDVGISQYVLGDIQTAPDGKSVAVPAVKQGSAMISALTDTRGLIVLEAQRGDVRCGDIVRFVPMCQFLD